MARMMQIGEVILGRYEVEDLLSEGGQASLARGRNVDTGSLVAIRQLTASTERPDYAQELARFKRAATLHLHHANVVDPSDYGEEDGEWFMIMPYIDGLTLEAQTMRAGGTLPVREASTIACQIASGLSACHAKGVVHRDIKPANILIDQAGRVYIIDFGICSVAHESTITQGDAFLGTLSWATPEQVVDPRRFDPRLDLYALGSTFYYCLTGAMPVEGDSAEQIMLSICQWTPPSPRQLNASIPAEVDEACMRLLAKQPEDRFQTAEEFVAALNGAAEPQARAAHCPSCGQTVLNDAKFCTSCGAGIGLQRVAPIHCLACGAAVLQNTSTCGHCGRLFGPSGHRLTFNAGSLSGVVFRIPEGIYEIGRDALSPRDHHISRKHLSVACVNGSVHVVDAGSANKTTVDGRLADRPFALLPGTELSIAGNTAIYTNN
ncbi:MAG: protein kinase [Planctomycetes bacterium]|nr:protein kinase [Planctomycetota bacterium]